MCVKRYIYILLVGILLVSCSGTKFVSDDQNMLNKVDVKIDEGYPDVDVSKYKSYVRQKGNQRWFSALKVPLGIYSLAGRDTSKWINRTLQSMGEARWCSTPLRRVRAVTTLRHCRTTRAI